MSDRKRPTEVEILPAESEKKKKEQEREQEDIVIDVSDPSEKESHDLIRSTAKEIIEAPSKDVSKMDPLYLYMQEVSRYDLLNPEEEQELARTLKDTGDIDVAKKLVQANLRLVVKIAMEYRSAYKNVLDLIQEGNIGLMKAVSKYDPDKGAKLSYYASWWIKSYILKFILDNFRLVKIGTTAEQKKLFYNLMREKERLMNMGITPDNKTISENLGVSEKAVALMDMRLSPSGSEVSIDTPLEDSNMRFSDMIPSEEEWLEDALSHQQGLHILQDHLKDFVDDLKERDREIFKKRLLTEVPPSLQAIADDYGVSRERIRQIEERLIKKLKVYMSEYLR